MAKSRKKVNKITKKPATGRAKAQSDLEKRARPLHKLVHWEGFYVEEVEAETHSHSYTPHSEMGWKRSPQAYLLGQNTRTTLRVKPYNSIVVKTLTFEGTLPVRSGDRIAAKIPRYERHVEKQRSSSRFLYTDRAYRRNEEAVRVIIQGEYCPQRTDSSANYHVFRKPKKH